MSDQWRAVRSSDGFYDFEVKQAGMPVMTYVLAVLTCWSIIVPAVVILMTFMRNRRYRFRAGPNGVVVNGTTYPLDRINELEIRNQRLGGVVANSGPGIGVVVTGAGGYALAGAAAGGAAVLQGTGNAMAANGYSVAIQVSSRHITLANNLKEVHARGLFADIVRAAEGKL